MSRLSLRPDEIWVTERDIDGITRLNSIRQFEEIDKFGNIFKLYSDDRLGETPKIQNSWFNFQCIYVKVLKR